MTILRWSWFFIYSLLVLPGHASNDNQKGNADSRQYSRKITRDLIGSPSSEKAKDDHAGPIAISVIIGTLLLVSFILFFLHFRKRKRTVNQIEDGVIDAAPQEPEWWHIDLGSAKGTDWALENKSGREGKRKSLDEGRPTKADVSSWARLCRFLMGGMKMRQNSERRSKASRPSDKDEYVARPRPVAPNHRPRYTSILDRPGNPPGFPPPSPHKNTNLARVILAVESREKSRRREAQISPKVVNFNGRSLPGAPELKLGLPRSPSGKYRRSWLARQGVQNLVLPLKEADAVLPPSVTAGLTLRQYTKSPHQVNPHSIVDGPATSLPQILRLENKKCIPAPVYIEEETTRIPGRWEAPSTGGVPRSKYQGYERALRSAPLGDHPSTVIEYPRPI